MNYRKITQNVTKLKPLEAYVYLLLASKSDFINLTSSVNEQTLADISGLSLITIKRHIKSFKDKNLIDITTERKVGAKGAYLFNHYKLDSENYSLIDTSLLNEPISKELIGFLVQLKLRCYNFTNLCKYSVRELAETLPYSKSTVERYLQQAEKEGYIKRNNNGILLINDNLFIVDKKSNYELVKEFYPEVLTDENILNHTID